MVKRTAAKIARQSVREALLAEPLHAITHSMYYYSDDHLQHIALSIGVRVEDVRLRLKDLDRAAFWHLSARGEDSEGNPVGPSREAPHKRRKKMEKVARDARRLLNSLRVESAAGAADGPGDPDILELLAYPEGSNEDLVRRLVGGVAELERLAREAADEVVKFDKLVGVKNNAGGDLALNGWIGDMMTLYREITGREPATSVGKPEAPNAGIECGPLIRFLEAAGKPLGIELSPAAWRSRVRCTPAATDK